MSKYVNVTKMSITLDNEVALELSAIAKELNEKKSHLIENALMIYFDMLDEKLSDNRWSNCRPLGHHRFSISICL